MKNINTTAAALIANYGFEAMTDRLFAGRGAWLSSGETIEVFFHGDMVTVHHEKWFWDGGDVEWKRSTDTTCHLSQVWGSPPRMGAQTLSTHSFFSAGAWAGAALAHSPNFREEYRLAKNNLKNLQKRY